MGILEDLKQQAEKARLKRLSAEARQAELGRIYREKVRPGLLRIQGYLAELIDQLEQVDWSVSTGFDFPGIGNVDNLEQRNYRLSIDSHRDPRMVTLRFECVAPDEKRYRVMPKSAGDEACQFLAAQKVQFTDWAIRDTHHELAGLMIQAKVRVAVCLLFEADAERAGIRVTSHNFNEPGETSFVARCQDIDDDWLDQLGRKILRQEVGFGQLRISDAERSRIRMFLEVEKRRRENLSVANHLASVPEKGFFPRLRNLLKKTTT